MQTSPILWNVYCYKSQLSDRLVTRTRVLVARDLPYQVALARIPRDAVDRYWIEKVQTKKAA